MVRSMPSRSGRAQAPTAPSRRQLQQERSDQTDRSPTSNSSTGSARSAALERRRALTTAGKAAVVVQGSLGAGRIRTGRDKRRPTPQQPGWVRRDQAPSRSVPFNLSRSSLPFNSRQHPLTNQVANERLRSYEQDVKGRFDRIVPLLQQVSALQHEPDFLVQAQRLSRAELGFDLPSHILERAWVRPLDMRGLFAWCVFESHRLFSDRFFQDDPLQGAEGSAAAQEFEQFLLDCGIIFWM